MNGSTGGAKTRVISAWDRCRHKLPTPDYHACLCLSTQAPVAISEQRKQDQKAVDTLLMKKLKDEPYLQAYLNAKFTLTKNDRVHELQF